MCFNKFYIEYMDDAFNGLNLLNVKLFQAILANTNHIRIRRVEDYNFCLSSFISIVQNSKRDIKYDIQAETSYNESSWLFDCSSSSIVSEYREKQHNITYEKTEFNSIFFDNIYINKRCV